jgi:hypothetical protein
MTGTVGQVLNFLLKKSGFENGLLSLSYYKRPLSSNGVVSIYYPTNMGIKSG